MTIRLAQVEDAPAMARVMVDTWLAAHRGQMPEEAWQKRRREWTYEVSEGGWREMLGEIAEGDNPGSCVYVALDETDTVVGLALGSPAESAGNTGEVNAIYVRPGHQGRGYGRGLLRAVAAHLAQAGMTGLIIGVLATNAPARRFYEALGGRLVGEREFDQEGVMLPEVVYGWTDMGVLRGEGDGNR